MVSRPSASTRPTRRRCTPASWVAPPRCAASGRGHPAAGRSPAGPAWRAAADGAVVAPSSGAAVAGVRFEAQRDRVHAVPVAGRRLRRVVEQVAQVRTAPGAEHLRAHPAETPVLPQLDRVVVAGRVEAGPAAVRVELGLGPEQHGAAGATAVRADPALLEQGAGPGALGRRLPEHRVLLRTQLGPPLLLGLLNLVGHLASSVSPILPCGSNPRRGKLPDPAGSGRPRQSREDQDALALLDLVLAPTRAHAAGPVPGSR